MPMCSERYKRHCGGNPGGEQEPREGRALTSRFSLVIRLGFHFFPVVSCFNNTASQRSHESFCSTEHGKDFRGSIEKGNQHGQCQLDGLLFPVSGDKR